MNAHFSERERANIERFEVQHNTKAHFIILCTKLALTSDCILRQIFIVKNIYCNNIILPGYIKCHFGADFNQKLLISILCYSLLNGKNYHIKYFEGPILAFQGFSQVLDITHLYMMFQTQVWHFFHFCEKVENV